MTFRNAWIGLGLLLIAVACAQQTTPSGGPMDETPPELLSASPPSLSLNYTHRQFELVFDEFISVEDFSNQLLVSPPLDNNPEYKLRGKKLTVWWEERLLDNTTYQFNFGEAIKDFREGNVNNDLLYVFSTGNFIDSMSISGAVYSAQSNEPVAGAKVLLYQNYEDSLPYTSRPDYLAVTGADGKFHARYLPADTFMLFVLEEQNSNFKYDGPPERIAFMDYLALSAYEDTTYSHVFALFEEADTSQYVLSSVGKDYGYHEVIFNLPVEQPDIRFYEEESDRELEALNVISKTSDTLRSWLSLAERPELEEIMVVVKDGERFADTLGWYIEIDPKYREKPKLEVSGPSGKLDPQTPFVLNFNYPLQQFDTSLVMLIEDSTRVYPDSVRISNFQRKLAFYYPYGRTPGYNLIALEGAFEDLYGKFSDSLNFVFGLNPDDYYGSLLVNVMLDDSLGSDTFVLELQSEKGAVLETVILTESQEIDFGKVAPALYKLRGIYDRDGDKQWSRGNYKEGLQPERQSFYPEEIKVRSNWTMDVDWTPTTPFD